MDDKKPILIKHSWDIILSGEKEEEQQILIYFKSFSSDCLPDIRFSIFSGISGNDKLTIVVSKTVAEPANATIKVSIDGREKNIVQMGCWITECVLDDISYLPADCRCVNSIIVECEIAWYGPTRQSNASDQIDLYHQTKKLLGTDNLTDMIIIVDDEEIPVHKIILAVQSPVFMTMFKTNISQSSNTNRIIVTNIDGFTLKLLIKFLYTGEINRASDVDDLLSMMSAAEKYQVKELKKQCEEALSMRITIKNALRILEQASACDVPKLIELIIAFMVNNKKEIAELTDFEPLYLRKPELLFQFLISVIEEQK